ncbi:glutaredoxin family protein [Alteromonas sp. BMJM2]|uniref:glutaredoxin family protein n=1 Tax=Alteromonas sp. BMJM2 TaxID=2954241 RepID=UPI0022B59EDD|nr:glutaredoxin domain-containing protein [Alteromonas sp. BMJM2]
MLRIYGYKGCHYCDMAQELLKAKGIPYNYYDIKSPEQKDKLSELKEQGLTTVPQVYKDDKHVGGYNELYSAVMLGAISK